MLQKNEKRAGTLRTMLAIMVLLLLVIVLENISAWIPGMPAIFSPTSQLFTVLKKGAVYSLVAVSMNLLNGFTGLFSLGQAGFMMLGAYTYAILTIALVFVLVYLINHSKIGMAMRAAAKDFETAQLMGIKINAVISMTFVIGSFLAAVGAMLYFTNYPSVAITSGGMPGLKAFVAAVFGGIGSIPGAVVGAFIIGLCEEIIKGLGYTTFSDAFTFAILIVVLCVKPTGLFGEKVTDKV